VLERLHTDFQQQLLLWIHRTLPREGKCQKTTRQTTPTSRQIMAWMRMAQAWRANRVLPCPQHFPVSRRIVGFAWKTAPDANDCNRFAGRRLQLLEFRLEFLNFQQRLFDRGQLGRWKGCLHVFSSCTIRFLLFVSDLCQKTRAQQTSL
jgi:hypothetical protein